ncbi:sideroflexin-5 [Xenopus laevis]|uniref:Uncharacterized protein n=2 Tax=Xenopus laevis TaxID=8355 RepID=A0A974I071_XENLA|nr:sideroflexin-5 [Xenopus laevis]OCT96530.1 hypothetical protein XELAEV_18008734mg [Xenopus laevis]
MKRFLCLSECQVVGLLLPNQTLVSTVFWQVGLNILVQRANKFTPSTRLLIQRFVPFPAVASANVCNVVLMRHSELEEGIDVLDSNGHIVGSSRIAARHRDSPVLPTLHFPVGSQSVIHVVGSREKYWQGGKLRDFLAQNKDVKNVFPFQPLICICGEPIFFIIHQLGVHI